MIRRCLQESKAFENGRPYSDLMDALPLAAKRDDWVYIYAMRQNDEVAEAAMDSGVFTDIAFNPKKLKIVSGGGRSLCCR